MERKILILLSLIFTTVVSAMSFSNVADNTDLVNTDLVKKQRVNINVVNATEAKYNDKQMRKSASQAWSESFEDWAGDDYFWLPEGWSRKATPEYMTPTNPHTWFVNKQSNEYVPAPIDGAVYAEILYNDAPQDEWLYTCELHPQDGDWFQYYVIFRPFLLFDYSKYDYKTDTFSSYDVVCDLQTYVSVDGGEYQQLNSLAEEYKNVDVHEISEVYYNGFMTNKKLSFDFSAYAGHTVKVAFRYVATDGDSMWIDAMTLGKPSMTAGYNQPESALYLGMTRDFQQPVRSLYLPDSTPLTWSNTSSLEATDFVWTYPSATDYTQNSTATTADLTASFSSFVTETDAASVAHNTLQVPQLHANGIASLSADYTLPIPTMKVGGKAQAAVDGEIVRMGASTCNPDDGVDILMLAGQPLFGYMKGAESLWPYIFGLSSDANLNLTAIANHFPKPEKPYAVRGVTVQCAGEISNPAFLKVSAYRRNIYGSLEETPEATAIIDVDNIYSEPLEPGSSVMLYTLPFLFADPFEVNTALWYKIEGITNAFNLFIPLQTAEAADDAHGYFELEYTEGGTSEKYIYNIGALTLEGKDRRNSFFFNLDMAYGDHDDWGHIDIEQPQPEMPELNVEPNSMKMVNLLDEDDSRTLPMRCGFYEDDDPYLLTLYPCIGELYEYEEGPYYFADRYSTYHFCITIPRYMIGKTQEIGSDEDLTVRYYDVLAGKWLVDESTSGTVLVEQTGDHMYSVSLKVLDANTLYAVAANFTPTEAWRWHDYSDERPNPNEYKLVRGGKYSAVHAINSCVVDATDADLYKVYLCNSIGVTSVAAMESLPASAPKPVVLTFGKEMNNGEIWGFSRVKNEHHVASILYEGVLYDPYSTDIDGGNITPLLSEDTRRITINSTIFGISTIMFNGGYPNMSLHYEGMFVLESTTDGINDLSAPSRTAAPSFNLLGQRIDGQRPGIVIRNGKKYLVR